MQPDKPEVVALVTDVRAAAGEYRQLRCGVDAYPKAKYTWKKDGVTLDPPSGAIKNSPRKQTTWDNKSFFDSRILKFVFIGYDYFNSL